MNTVAADTDVATVQDRVLGAGISHEVFAAHLAAGRIAVDGQRVTDPQTPAPPPSPVQIMLGPG